MESTDEHTHPRLKRQTVGRHDRRALHSLTDATCHEVFEQLHVWRHSIARMGTGAATAWTIPSPSAYHHSSVASESTNGSLCCATAASYADASQSIVYSA